ncbi:hypothetical protein GCM10010195_13490 [Kitasatospora griseola]|nr:hypothetical protein GCM10010195_13490 [Kitasatospora griseola]
MHYSDDDPDQDFEQLDGDVAEYARHNGHADLLRECIDGSTGH